MYSDCGKKIKKVSYFIMVIGIIASIATAFLLLETYGPLALAILIAGIVSSYISSLLIEGFSELIEKSSENTYYSMKILEKLEGLEVEKECGERDINNKRTEDIFQKYWTCSKCGRMNCADITICDCGNDQRKDML